MHSRTVLQKANTEVKNSECSRSVVEAQNVFDEVEASLSRRILPKLFPVTGMQEDAVLIDGQHGDRSVDSGKPM